MATSRSRLSYRWWARDPTSSTEPAIPGHYFRTYLPAIALTGIILALPPVTAATNVSAFAVVLLCGSHAVWIAITTFVLYPTSARVPALIDIAIACDVILAIVLCALFPLLSNRPDSLLWVLGCVYTAMNGTLPSFGPSLALLFAMPIAAASTIPIFLVRGADPAWSVGGPLLVAGISAMTYHFIAFRAAETRDERDVIEAERAELQRRLAEIERTHLARDLHDVVGSTLTLAALYGELVERHAERPAILRRIANNLRGEARQGLGDLRGVLGALAPGDDPGVSGLANSLRELAGRVTAVSDLVIDIELAGHADGPLESPIRLALVRVFQETLHNVLRHAAATRISVRLACEQDVLTLEITDDGAGFDPARAPSGRGLPGLARRIQELGGELSIDSAPGHGTRIHAAIPVGDLSR